MAPFTQGGREQGDIPTVSFTRTKKITWPFPPYPTPDLEARYCLCDGIAPPSNIHLLDDDPGEYETASSTEPEETVDFLKYLKSHADPTKEYNIEDLDWITNVSVRAVKSIPVGSSKRNKDKASYASSSENSSPEYRGAIPIPGIDTPGVTERYTPLSVSPLDLGSSVPETISVSMTSLSTLASSVSEPLHKSQEGSPEPVKLDGDDKELAIPDHIDVFEPQVREEGGAVTDRSAGVTTCGSFPEHDTLILKWFPPFVAILGPQEPLSMRRQSVEAKALRMFERNAKFGKFARQSGICIPRVLKLDLHNRVLVMSDIGNWPSLKVAFQRLAEVDETREMRAREEKEQERDGENMECSNGGGETGPGEKGKAERGVEEHAERKHRQKYGQDIWAAFTKIGNSIGEFFGKLHAPSNIARMSRADLNNFENPNMKEFTWQYRILDLKCILRGAGVRDYSALMKIIHNDWREPEGSDVFAIGELTIDSFLLQDTTTLKLIGLTPEFPVADHTLGLVGWQFAGPGRGINGDMAKLFASIRILTADTLVGNIKHFAAMAMLKGIIKSYCRQGQAMAPIEPLSWNGEKWDWAAREFPHETMAILRSAFIVYGRTLIDAAWVQSEMCKCDNGPHPFEELCGVRGSLLGDGVWHVRMAGIDVLEFENNWQGVLEDGTSPLLGFVFGE